MIHRHGYAKEQVAGGMNVWMARYLFPFSEKDKTCRESCMLHPTSHVRFGPILAQKARFIMCKTDPNPIWMSWSGFGQTHLVRKQASVQESSGPVSGRTQPACYQFPTFRLGSVFAQMARIIVCKTSLDPVWFWLSVSGFGQTDPVRKQAGVQ